ncbi:amino acid permease [Dietzia sp. 179-F 9C3 NHS]|uniref:amino acid permease n=1 Tax=Dietzia sp. 179-F 9C3 NHS TaxID=3374295 RepID=UPI003879028E
MTDARTSDGGTASPDLSRTLRARHLTMMGLGSAIGAGLFLGTGVGISAAGPAVLLSYLAAGVIVLLVMRMLGEMGAAIPESGSFASYAGEAFGRHARFVVGWLYWFMLIMVMGAEITGASAIMSAWFGVDPWIPALACMLVFAVVNLARVRAFGEFEFWFAIIKVAVIIAFLVLGVLLVAGLLPGHTFVGATNLTGHGGFLPNGWAGVAAGLLAVAFAFGGIEIVTIAAAESEDPVHNIGVAIRSVIWRIAVFYLGSVAIIVTLLPWTEQAAADSAADSPFAAVLRLANLPYAVGFLEAVIVLALLSSFNAQIYGTSRLAFSLARQGDGPEVLTHTNVALSPSVAVWVSVFFGFVAVALQWWSPEGLLAFLLNAVGATLLVVWLAIAASQIRLRPRLEAEGRLRLRMWGHPWLPWLTVALILALAGLMLTDATARTQIVSACVVVAVLAALSVVNARARAH